MAHPALARTTISLALVEEFTAAGYWRWPGWVAQLLEHARTRPDAIGLVDSRQRLTFREWARRSDRLAARLAALGIGVGDIVGVQLPNVAEFHVVRYALAALGAVTLPIGVVYREQELLHALGTTQASALVVPGALDGHDHAASALQLRERLPHLKHVLVAGGEAPAGALSLDARLVAGDDDPAEAGDAYPRLDAARADPNAVDLLLMSSGTTGRPKIIMATPNVWLHVGAATARILRTTAEDIVLSLPPLTGGAGYNNGLGSPAVSGATVVLQPSFDAEAALELIRLERVTSVAAVPTQAVKMLEVLERRFASGLPGAEVRVWLSVGAYLPASTAQRLEALLGCRVINIFGAVEAAMIAANALDDPPESRHTSIGRIAEGVAVRLVDESGRDVPGGTVGDLLTRQPGMAAGYFADEASTRAVFEGDGWVRTGDCALVDSDGLLRIQGRKKDIINRGGMKISAEEIEDLLRAHPAIVDVAVVAMPDPVLGEKACAYIVSRGETPPAFDEVIAFLRARQVATFKLPERLEVVADFPYSSGFKVQKSVLRQDIARKLASENPGAPG
jgi:non-ribosomal peptide synthetase component E (peptide arylation enzyme)